MLAALGAVVVAAVLAAGAYYLITTIRFNRKGDRT